MNLNTQNTNLLSSLNELQKEAVTSSEKRLLVLAGAGSGKTKTLITRMNWLLFAKNVKPANILAITFTKNAANEMIDRLIDFADESGRFSIEINQKGLSSIQRQEIRRQYIKQHPWIDQLTVCTFHSLCYKILRERGVHQFDNRFKVITNEVQQQEELTAGQSTESVFAAMLKVLITCCQKPAFLLRLKRYILDYYVDKIEASLPFSGRNYDRGYTSLRGDRVRSKSEQYIADWLYRHGIRYVYEPVVNFGDFDFRPDFFIPEANLYLEHNSNLSSPMHHKEEQFKKAGKRLVRTFEPMTKNSGTFSKHLERIIRGNLSENYRPESALSYEEEFSGYHQHVKDFARDVLQVLDKIKVEKVHSSRVFQNAQKSKHQRVRDFYLLASELIREYHNYLTNRSYLDFNDLTIQAVKLLENHQEVLTYLQKKYEYILVDEFQDVNSLQIELLQQLATPQNHLFCVGDDWQGIYGFRGSDVRYIIDFDKYFPGSKTIKLNLNYRSNQTIVEASNEVIRRNKFIVDKDLVASNKHISKLNIFAAEESGIDDVEYLLNRVKYLQKEGYQPHDILILYRRSKMYEPYKRALEKDQIKVMPRTIHAAKGLEAKAVFIVGLMQGYGGFPDIWYNDAIYQVIKKDQYDLMLEEERRLFYVALTRAREEINLLTVKGNESQFIDEIPLRYFSLPKVNIMSATNCKNCGKSLEPDANYCSHCGERVVQ